DSLSAACNSAPGVMSEEKLAGRQRLPVRRSAPPYLRGSMPTRSQRTLARALTVLGLSFTASVPGAVRAAECPPPAHWMRLEAGSARPASLQEAITHAAQQRVVLLGENHDSAEHHRWQLHVLAAL